MPNQQSELPGLFDAESDISSNLDTILMKPWYLSKRVMATAATIIQGGLMTIFGIDLSPEETTQLTMVLLGMGTSASGVIAMYGIITSKYKVQIRKPKQ